MRNSIKKFLMSLFTVSLLAGLVLGGTAAQTAHATGNASCRFGITSVHGADGYDIESIGVGSYLDWAATSNPVLPSGMEHLRVLRLSEALWPITYEYVDEWVDIFPGSTWLVGNEPDTVYEGQDGLTAEVYAIRFHLIAEQIRTHDPTAKIGFGTVVQPTPIRLRYLDRAWTKLVSEAGGESEASALIDIWSIHSFILNETGGWGTGVPPGFICPTDCFDAVTIYYPYTDTYSITIFQQRVEAFRTWMASKGEQNKPLWITEYGSLFPSDPSHGFATVSAEDSRNYMLATFNYLLGADDPNTGLPSDGNRLVQRWFWYSLNDYLWRFGGSLFDPENEKALTPIVGQAFVNYTVPFASANVLPDLLPTSVKLFQVDPLNGAYRLDVTIGNTSSTNTGSIATINLYIGETKIAGPITTAVIQPCGESIIIPIEWLGVAPNQVYTIRVEVDTPEGVDDSNPANNDAEFNVYTGWQFLPLIKRP